VEVEGAERLLTGQRITPELAAKVGEALRRGSESARQERVQGAADEGGGGAHVLELAGRRRAAAVTSTNQTQARRPVHVAQAFLPVSGFDTGSTMTSLKTRTLFVLLGAALGAALIAQSQQGPSLPAHPQDRAADFPHLPPCGCSRSLQPAREAHPGHRRQIEQSTTSDWLTWRRTYDDAGFSPLKQIDRGNVGNLQVAWTWSLAGGANETTRWFTMAVLFAFGYGDRARPSMPATGDLLWQYARQLPKDAMPATKRNLSIYGDKLFVRPLTCTWWRSTSKPAG